MPYIWSPLLAFRFVSSFHPCCHPPCCGHQLLNPLQLGKLRLFKVFTKNKNNNISAANRLTTTLQRDFSVDLKVLRYTSHKNNMFALIRVSPVL